MDWSIVHQTDDISSEKKIQTQLPQIPLFHQWITPRTPPSPPLNSQDQPQMIINPPKGTFRIHCPRTQITLTHTRQTQHLPNPVSTPQKRSKKKVKVRFRSSSLTRRDDKILESLTPTEDIFLNNSTVTMLQFKHVLENYSNKNINIHNLCKEIDSNIPSLMQLIEDIRPKINKTSLKSHLTRLSNLLFQALPPQDSQN